MRKHLLDFLRFQQASTDFLRMCVQSVILMRYHLCSTDIPDDSNSSLKQVTSVLFETDTLKLFVAEVLKRMEIFEFFHHLGFPEEKDLGIVYSMCSQCHQSFMLHHCKISINCCVKVCDFCFYDNPTDTFYSCRHYIIFANDTNIKKMCRICYQTYPINASMHYCQV